MLNAHKIITILICGCCVLMIGCQQECCILDRSPEIAWSKSAPAPVPVAKVEIPKLVEEPPIPKIVEEPKKVEEPPIKTEEPLAKVEPLKEEQPVKVDVPAPKLPDELAPIEEFPIEPVPVKIVMESGFNGDKQAVAGTPANVICKVTNKGAKDVENSQLHITLPEGLKFDDNPNQTTQVRNLEKMAPNAALDTPLRVVADKSGSYTITSELKVADKTINTNAWTIAVTAKPQGELLLDGPAKANMGTQFVLAITFTNKGSEALKNVKLQAKLQDGLIYDGAEPDGIHVEEERTVTWTLANLEPGSKQEYKIKVTSIDKGKVDNRARALLDNQTLDQKKLETEIIAEAGLSNSQYDTTDPVEVGQKTTYVTEITNTGFKDATEVLVVFTIPAETKFVSASAEGGDMLNFNTEGQTVTFDQIPTIKPSQKITFKVVVEVLKAGDLLNEVAVTMKEFNGPIKTQEGTKAFVGKSQ